MGIYDREYYRDETSGSGWLTGVTPAVKVIVGLNVAVFLANWILPDLRLTDWMAAASDDIFQRGRLLQLITAPFFHQEGLHILMNMVVLWIFGREVESIYGTLDFVLMYITAAVLSTLAWAMLDFYGAGGGRSTIMFGASGAVMAVFMIYALYYPRREILVFFVLPMPIWLLLVLFLAFDFLVLVQQVQGTAASAGRATGAHLGGALYGYLYKTYDLRFSRLLGRLRLRPRLKVLSPPPRERAPRPTRAAESNRPMAPTPAPSVRPSVNVVFPEEQLDQRVDEILAKIAREGRDGLTEEENRILLEASRRARLRRSEHL